MNVQILLLEQHAADQHRRFKIGVPAPEAFRNSMWAGIPPARAELTEAKAILLAALVWSWYEWHRTNQLGSIQAALVEVTQRTFAIHPPGSAEGRWASSLWADLDSFLIQCAVLSGDRATMEAAAAFVSEADPASDREQAVPAWSGILKHRILGTPGEAAQLQVWQRQRPRFVVAAPSPSLVTAFVLQDQQQFHRGLRAACQKHWALAEKQGAIVTRTDDSVCLDTRLGRKNPLMLWPWPEAVLGRLAPATTPDCSIDPVWLPPAFLRNGPATGQKLGVGSTPGREI